MDVQHEGCRQALPLQCVAGPAVIVACHAGIITLVLFVLAPLIVFFVPVELDDHSAHGNHTLAFDSDIKQYTHYNKIVWCFFAPTLLVLMDYERICFSYFLVPAIEVIGKFKVATFDLGFVAWCFSTMADSLVAHLVLVTTGIFVATTVKLLNSPVGHLYNKIWISSLQQLPLGWIPGWTDFVIPRFNFGILVLTFWSLMFLQALYGLVSTIPVPSIYQKIKGSCIEYRFLKRAMQNEWEIGEFRERDGSRWTFGQMTDHYRVDKNDQERITYWQNDMPVVETRMIDYEVSTLETVVSVMKGNQPVGTQYHTILEKGSTTRSDHGAVLLVLANCTRMASITGLEVNYTDGKMKYYLDKNSMGPLYGLMKRSLSKEIFSIALQGVLQNGFQLYLQVSLLAISTRLRRTPAVDLNPLVSESWSTIFSSIDWAMCFNISVAVGNLMKKAWHELLFINLVRRVLSEVGVPGRLGHEVNHNGEGQFCRVRLLQTSYWQLCACYFLYIVLLTLVVAKVFGIFICKESVLMGLRCADFEGLY